MQFGTADAPPPVNNALLPDIYNRLDAETIEKTRVINTQLDERLKMQEKIINRYRVAAERIYRKETRQLRHDLARISGRLPTIRRVPNLQMANVTRYGATRARLHDLRHGKRRLEEKTDLPFCQRHFIHHLPTKSKFYARPPSPDSPVPEGGNREGEREEGQGRASVLPALDLVGTGREGVVGVVETPRGRQGPHFLSLSR